MENHESLETKVCSHCNKPKSINNYYFNMDFCNDCISEEDKRALERTYAAKLKSIKIQKILEYHS